MSTNAGRPSRAALLGLSMLLGGCATSAYVYRPAEEATATIDGYTAARYAIPPEAPQGDVRVASFGVMDIRQPGRDEDIAALHVRLIVANDGGTTTWRMDTRKVRAELRGAGDAGVPLVSTRAAGLPFVEIPPGQERTIDLFYPLPASLEDEEDIPAFDLRWSVRTDARVVTERTPFERIEIDRHPPTYVVMGAGWYGPYWWYDPWYYPPGVVVRPTVILSPRAVPSRVRIRHHR